MDKGDGDSPKMVVTSFSLGLLELLVVELGKEVTDRPTVRPCLTVLFAFLLLQS